MLGSLSDADNAVQEAWARLHGRVSGLLGDCGRLRGSPRESTARLSTRAMGAALSLREFHRRTPECLCKVRGEQASQSLAESAKGETGVVNGLHSNIGLLVETHHALRGVAGSARETAGVQAADGVELPLGVVVRQ